ncbi:MAG: hypothetical protein ACK401_02375 [Archaeoglobaceae archaeon]
MKFIEDIGESKKPREELEKLRAEKLELEKKLEELNKLRFDLEEIQNRIAKLKKSSKLCLGLKISFFGNLTRLPLGQNLIKSKSNGAHGFKGESIGGR